MENLWRKKMDRKSGIGGSECAAVMGLSRWKTPYQVFIDKTSEEENKIDNDVMRWGRALEPLIIQEYQERTGNEVDLMLDEKSEQKKFTSSKYPWLMAHIDGLVKSKRLIIEAKTTRFFGDDWGDEGTDRIPIEYLIQCAHYCIVLGGIEDITGVDIAALGSTSDFRLYHYNRNEKLEKRIISETEKFWNEHILTGIPPQPTISDDLTRIYKDCVDDVVIASLDDISACSELLKIKSEIKRLEQTEESIKQSLKLTMKDKNTMIDKSGKILATWKTSETKRIDQQKLKLSNMDLSDYYDIATTRRFLIKGE